MSKGLSASDRSIVQTQVGIGFVAGCFAVLCEWWITAALLLCFAWLGWQVLLEDDEHKSKGP